MPESFEMTDLERKKMRLAEVVGVSILKIPGFQKNVN